MRPTAARPAHGSAGTGLRDVLGVLARQRWTVLGCLALGLGAGVAAVLLARPVYETSALVRVDDARPRAAGAAPQQLDLLGLLAGGAGVGTEIEVLRTRKLAESVADSLGLRLEVASPRKAVRSRVFSSIHVAPDAPEGAYRLRRDSAGRFAVEDARTGARLGSASPGGALRLPGVDAVLSAEAGRYPRLEVAVAAREQVVRALAGALEVSRPSREANVVRLAYRSTDPVLARDVPNVLAARFVELRQEVHTAEARSTARFLRAQLDSLTRELAAAEQVLQRFQQGNNVVDLETEGRTGLTQLAQLQAEHGALRTEHDALAALLAGADRQAAATAPGQPSPYRRLAAVPALMRNQTTAELLASLARAEEERAALLLRRRPTDPDVQALTARVAQVEGELRGMADTYRAALAGQIASLDALLADSRGRLDVIPAKKLQFARLSRQPQVLSEMYAMLQAHLKEAEIAEAVEDPSVRVVDPAVLPTRAVSPRPKLILVGAGVLSLLLALGVGWLREYSDETVHTTGDLELAIGAPVLALIPRLGGRALRRGAAKVLPSGARPALASGEASVATAPATLLASTAPATPEGDAYDWLQTNILFAASGKELKTVLVTSAVPGDGKTTTAMNLALSIAQRGERVLLVDGDLRRGRVAELMGTPGVAGLAELMGGAARMEDVLHQASAGGGVALSYMTAGSLAPHPTQLLRSMRTQLLLQWAARNFDRVVIDSPPVHVVADAAVLAQLADGVVLVARSGVTPFGALANAAEQLQKAGATLLGAVMNDVDYDRDARYDRAYRWYGYGRTYYGAAGAA